MINNKKILAVIPARGGSKGVPRKNIKNIAKKPLIVWTIEEAKKSNYIDYLMVSTEDEEIANVAKSHQANVPFLRPMALAQDDTPGISPVIDVINKLDLYDYVILLQPTSPLRSYQDIDDCIEFCINNSFNSVVSVTKSEKSPKWLLNLSKENILEFLTNETIPLRRQDEKEYYTLNGAVYIANINWLRKNSTFIKETETRAFVMPKERSFDIDDEIDFRICEYFLENL